nr:PAS domain S-box protein [Oceanococcus sp. HetDA_MAG_MS8]
MKAQLARSNEYDVSSSLDTEVQNAATALLEACPDAVVICDSHGRIVLWNAASECLFGYSREEVLGLPVTVIIPNEHKRNHNEGLRRLATTGEHRLVGSLVEVPAMAKSGEIIPVELSLGQSGQGASLRICAVIRDVRERQRVLRDLETQRTRLQAMNDRLHELVNATCHTLTEPLRTTQGLVTFIEESSPEVFPPSQAKALALIRKTLRKGVADLSVIHRMGQIHTPEIPQPVDLFGFLHNQVLPALTQAPKGVFLCFAELQQLYVATRPLFVLLFEVLKNACEHARPNDEELKVWVAITQEHGQTTLAIWDNGANVCCEYGRPELIENGLDLMRRSENSVGLPIAAYAAKQLGGDLRLACELHGGLIVRVTLPNSLPGS